MDPLENIPMMHGPLCGIEDAGRAAIAWSQEAEAGTMHLRSLRNKLRKAAGLDPIPDHEPVEPLAP